MAKSDVVWKAPSDGTAVATELLARIEEAARAIQSRSALRPEVGIVLGTGLGELAGLETEAMVPYGEIPGFPVSTVETHAGELHLGTLAGRAAAVMKGRVHYYEGYSMQDVAFPIRVLKAIGCGTLVRDPTEWLPVVLDTLTSACGSMNPDLPPGTITVTTDHVNLMGDSPLIGENDERLGERFPDMSEPYSRALVNLAESAALGLQIQLPRVVFVAVPGPNLETAAEYRFLRSIGADVVGMSVVPENIAAVHGGQRVLALNVVTDACLPDNLRPVDIPEILRVAGHAAPTLGRLVTEVVRRLDNAA